MKDRPIPLVDDIHAVRRESEPTDRARIVERVLGEDALQIQKHGHGQIFSDQFSHELHRAVVVDDHPFAPVTGLTTRSQHFLGYTAGRRGTLQLTRGNRLLDQRAHQVTVPGIRRHDICRQFDAPAGISVDLVKHAVQISGIAERERPARLVVNGKRMAHRPSDHLRGNPPLFIRKPFRRIEILEL